LYWKLLPPIELREMVQNAFVFTVVYLRWFIRVPPQAVEASKQTGNETRQTKNYGLIKTTKRITTPFKPPLAAFSFSADSGPRLCGR
jgi:hypothetical protein